METILEEIIVHFRPEPGEELHSAVHALLIKCFQVLVLFLLLVVLVVDLTAVF